MPSPSYVQKFNKFNKFNDPSEIRTPPGFVRLLAGQQLIPGDAVYRHTFGQFVPFSPSQIKSCDTVLSHEYVIRQTTEGKRV